MSGHSKWSTIKHKKAVTDVARGKLFSKLSKAISIAVKDGGGGDPQVNHKLRVAVEQAKLANMPKDKIENAVRRAESSGNEMVELLYEGFGPCGVSVMLDVITDNKNRTAQEIKTLFSKAGGDLAGPGAVSFNFNSVGRIFLEKSDNMDDQILSVIDMGAHEVQESGEGIEVITSMNKLTEIKDACQKQGYSIIVSELIQNPVNMVNITNKEEAKKVIDFLDKLQNHEDVQKVHVNADFSEDVLEQIA